MQRLAQDLYYRFTGPDDGVTTLGCLGIAASFSAANVGELRRVEAATITEHSTMDGLLSHLSEGDCFMDVGSEYGVYAILAAKLVGPAGLSIAIEPYSPSYAILKKNVEMNELQNVLLFPLALGDCETSIGMADMRDGEVACATPCGSGSIAAMRGDELIRQNGLPVPNVVKMDIEGYEYKALLGLQETLKSPVCRILCCEIHPMLLPDRLEPDVVIDLIREYGFTTMNVAKRGPEIHVLAEKG
jgi:FkbM family methyltransferase